MTFLKNIALIAFCLSGGTLARAQSIPFKLYTPHDGLPQSQITCMFQDSRGYIWVGTKSGLCYFNGVKFQILTVKDGLPNLNIGQIQEDSTGNIWFCTGKWFCKYDGKQVTYDTSSMAPVNWRFYIDKSGTAWCINSKDGLLYNSKNFKTWACISQKDPVLHDKKWGSCVYDKKYDRILLRSTYGTNNSIWNISEYKDGKLRKFSKSFWFSHVAESNNERHLGTSHDSIYEMTKDSFTFITKVKNTTIIDAIRRPTGNIWFINGKNLYCLDTTGKVDTLPLNITSTNLIFEDKDKNVWLGTEEGLIRFYPEGFNNFSKTQLGSVWSMVEDKEGGMWFGDYYTGQLRRYDGKTIVEKKIDYAIHPFLGKGELGNFYFGGAKDKVGNLYFPIDRGISKYDGERFSLLTTPNKENHNISLFFYLDTVRNIIISGTGGGINIVQLKNGATKFYGKEKGVHCGGFILGVAKDGDGRYWLSTNMGMSVFDYDRDTVIRTYTERKKNFPYYSTCTVFGDVKGNIWAGSAQGLLRYDVKSDTFELMVPKTIGTGISSLNGYKDKYLVVGALDGVYFLDLQAYYNENKAIKIKCFNQHNGYLGIEPNQNCAYVDSKNNVWIAAADMVTKITPSELDMTAKPLVPYITQINNEKILYTRYNKVIELPYNTNTAKIFFEAVGFERPFHTEFSYKLNNGSVSPWLEEDYAVIDNLSSGTYTFQLRTRPSGSFDESDIQSTQIRFKIDIPFYRNSYFPLLAAFSLMLLGGGIWYYHQNRQLREQRIAQQHRAYILQQEQLEQNRSQQIKYLQLQTLQAQLNPHFIFGVLQAVQTRIYQSKKEEAVKHVVDLGNLIRRFLESSIGMDISKLRQSEITLQQEIDLLKTYIEFEQLQYNDRFDYQITIDSDLDAQNVRVPSMMIQPYIENAIKHGLLYERERKGLLEVKFKKSDNAVLICTIIDNGVGRKRAKEIQDAHIQMYKSRSTQILEDRIRIMREMGYAVSVQTIDNPEGGTIVQLEMDM